MRRFAQAVSLGVLFGCRSSEPAADQAAEPTPQVPAKPTAAPLPAGVTIEIANQPKACQRTLCLGGPADQTEPNMDLAELCRRAPGVIRRCEGSVCKSAWPIDEWRVAMDVIATSLDLDGDGKVDADDPACAINLAGWSTGGGVLAESFVDQLTSEARMSTDRARIDRMVLVAPRTEGALDIPASVRKAWIYRNTLAPADDCSNGWPAGPWISAPPACGADTQCWDYDYSLEPALGFVSRRGARSGAAIDHCNIMAVVAKVGLDNLGEGIEAAAEHVPRLSDGRRGGRPSGPP